MFKQKQQQGRSLVEIIGVIAIIGVLSVGSIVGFNFALNKYRANAVIGAITFLSQQVRSFYSLSGKYNGLGVWTSDGSNGNSNSTAATIIKKSDISIPYPLTIAEQPSVKGSSFAIGVTGIPISVCVELHSKDWNNGNSDYDGIGLPGTGEYKATMTEIIEGCKSVVKDEDRSFVIYFKPIN